MVYKFKGLETLRGFLALTVCCAHSFTILVRPYSSTAKGFAHYFWVLSARFSVLWFFVLSGFVITNSIANNLQKNKGLFQAREFATSRIARVAPPLIAAIFITLILSYILSLFNLQTLPQSIVSERSDYKQDLLSQLMSLLTLGLRGQLSGGLNGPLWSLMYEIQLYVLAGLLAIIISATYKIRCFYAGLFLIFVSLLINFGNALQFICFFNFFIGAIAFNYFKKASTSFHFNFAIFSGMTCVLLIAISNLNDFDTTLIALLSQAVFALSAASVIQLIARSDLLDKFSFTGKFSYTLYVIHFPILLFVFFMLQPLHFPRTTWAFGIIFSVLFASFIARWLEDTARWKKRLVFILENLISFLKSKHSLQP